MSATVLRCSGCGDRAPAPDLRRMGPGPYGVARYCPDCWLVVTGPPEPDDRCTCGHPECGAC